MFVEFICISLIQQFCILIDPIVTISSEVGEQLVTDQHEVSDFFDGEIEGVIVNQLRPGLIDKDGLVVRSVGVKLQIDLSIS